MKKVLYNIFHFMIFNQILDIFMSFAIKIILIISVLMLSNGPDQHFL